MTLTEQEHRIATLARQGIEDWRLARSCLPPSLILVHPDDLTEQLADPRVTLWGLRIRADDSVKRGTVRIDGPQ